MGGEEPVKEGKWWNLLLIYVLSIVLVLTERSGAATNLSHLDMQKSLGDHSTKITSTPQDGTWTSIYWIHDLWNAHDSSIPRRAPFNSFPIHLFMCLCCTQSVASWGFYLCYWQSTAMSAPPCCLKSSASLAILKALPCSQVSLCPIIWFVFFFPDRITTGSTFIPSTTQPTLSASCEFSDIGITQGSNEITWSSGWNIQISSCNGVDQSKRTMTVNQCFTFITLPNSSQ